MLEVGVGLRVRHDLLHALFKTLPLLLIAKRGQQQPEIASGTIKLCVGVDVILCTADRLVHGTRVGDGIALDEQTEGRDGVGIVVTLAEFEDSLLQAMKEGILLVARDVFFDARNSVFACFCQAVTKDLSHLLDSVFQILLIWWRTIVGACPLHRLALLRRRFELLAGLFDGAGEGKCRIGKYLAANDVEVAEKETEVGVG